MSDAVLMCLVHSPGIEVFVATALVGLTIGIGAIATVLPGCLGLQRRTWIAAGQLTLAVCAHLVVVQEYGWRNYDAGLTRLRDELLGSPGAIPFTVFALGFAVPGLLLLLAAIVDRRPGDDALWHERVLARFLARFSPAQRRSPWLVNFMAGSRSAPAHDETNTG
jgi:hypothetical protein